MKLRVVARDGVRQANPEAERSWGIYCAQQAPSPEQVHAEASRRIKATGYEQQAMREFATGRPINPAVKYLCMQIRFAAEALASLRPIPADFRQDRYWPS